MIKKNDILLPIICAFKFRELGIFFLLICETRMNVNSHFFGKYFIIEVEMFLWFNQSLELILEIIKKLICFIQEFLRILSVFPIGRGLKYGYDFYITNNLHFFSYFLGGISCFLIYIKISVM